MTHRLIVEMEYDLPDLWLECQECYTRTPFRGLDDPPLAYLVAVAESHACPPPFPELRSDVSA
jgi:hypothetical protein